MSATFFQIPQPKVIHQNIDGEVVVINLDTGTYYSLLGSGARVWSLIEQQASVSKINEVLRKEYADTDATLPESVTEFIDQLRSESLIVPAQEQESCGFNQAVVPSGKRFEKPVLQKFTDMQALLLIDPIHEVQEAGWPHIKPTEK